MSRFLEKILALFVLASVANTSAFAANCDEMRLDAPGGSMEHVIVRDQGELGACSGAVAAAMLDAYRFSHEPPEGDNRYDLQSSAIEAVFSTAVAQKKTYRDALQGSGLDECDVADYLMKTGACDQAIEAQPPLPDDASFIGRGYDAQQDLEDAKPHAKSGALDLIQSVCHFTQGELKTRGLKSNTKQLSDLLAAEIKEKETELTSLFADRCAKAGRIPIQHHTCAGPKPALNPLHPEKTLKIILDHLNDVKPVQPMTVGYCQNLLTDGHSYKGFSPSRKKDEPYDTADSCVPHASLVIGKRPSPRTGKCQLLIQNSWGADCDGISKDWTNGHDDGCQGGKVWVDADVLTRNTDDYSFLF